MTRRIALPGRTRINWLIDFTALLGFGLMILSGNLFLAFPSSGEVGELHSLGSALTFAAITIHFVLHWQWVKTMAGRCVKALLPKSDSLSTSIRLTVIIDLLIAVCFLVTIASGALVHGRNEASGIYAGESFGGFQGRRPGDFLGTRSEDWAGRQAVDRVASPLFQWATLDLIHLGAVMVLFILVSIHLLIHWRWIVNVTCRFFRWDSSPIC